MADEVSDRPIRVHLVGPRLAGKSTQAGLLSEALGVPHVNADASKWTYFAEAGYDEERGRELYRAGSFDELLRYQAPFVADAIERTLAAHARGVFDFGGGVAEVHGRARVARAFEGERVIVHLTPSDDLERSRAVLAARAAERRARRTADATLSEEEAGRLRALEEHYLEASLRAGSTVATHVVMTDRPPEETLAELLAIVEGTG